MFPEGSMAGFSWDQDPKRFAFTAARYKFVAKMVEGMDKVLEVGCNDGFFSRIVRQHVTTLVAIDKDHNAIKIAREMNSEWLGPQGSRVKVPNEKWNIDFRHQDIMEPAILCQRGFDCVYCLDVFEHIKDAQGLLKNLAFFSQMCIIGTPSAESQIYASPVSQAEHINCVTKSHLKLLMAGHFKHVITFGMNDEVLHTGFDPMCQYIFGLGFGTR